MAYPLVVFCACCSDYLPSPNFGDSIFAVSSLTTVCREYSKRQSDSIQQKKRAGGKAHYKAQKRKRPAGGWKA